MTDLALATIAVDPATVRERLDAYRRAARTTRTAEDRLLAHAYYQASRGRQIISLAESVRAGGLDEHGFPRIAVARAIAQRVDLDVAEGGATFRDVRCDRSFWSLRSDLGWWHVSVAWPELPQQWGAHAYSAMVPMVPPECRPRAHKRSTDWFRLLSNYHILWEATWEKVRPRAPRDPALLRHIAGDLWVVMRTWDLSELERAVLSGVRSRA